MFSNMTTDALTGARSILSSRFGFGDFRPGQEQVVETLLAGRSALAVFPTGGGKSLCYQLPALLLDGVTVVVSPLIALMKDQIDALVLLGIDAARLDSSLGPDEVRDVSERLRAGSLKLLYVAPERFNNERFLAQLEETPISLFAVDEAHCISRVGPQLQTGLPQAGIARTRARCRARPRADRHRHSGGRARHLLRVRDRGDGCRRHRLLPSQPDPADDAGPGRGARGAADRPAARAPARADDRLRDPAANGAPRRVVPGRSGSFRAALPRGHEPGGPRRDTGVVDGGAGTASSSRRSRSAWGSTRRTFGTSTT